MLSGYCVTHSALNCSDKLWCKLKNSVPQTAASDKKTLQKSVESMSLTVRARCGIETIKYWQAQRSCCKIKWCLQQLRFSKDGIGRTNASNGSIEVAPEIQINAEYVFFLRGSALAENEACSWTMNSLFIHHADAAWEGRSLSLRQYETDSLYVLLIIGSISPDFANRHRYFIGFLLFRQQLSKNMLKAYTKQLKV